MPPKRDLIQTGPKHVSQVGPSEGKKGSAMRPSSSRALVLRNGKYGAMGTGELVSLRKKLSGREKLDLLAGTRDIWFSYFPMHTIDRGSCSASCHGSVSS